MKRSRIVTGKMEEIDTKKIKNMKNEEGGGLNKYINKQT